MTVIIMIIVYYIDLYNMKIDYLCTNYIFKFGFCGGMALEYKIYRCWWYFGSQRGEAQRRSNKKKNEQNQYSTHNIF